MISPKRATVCITGVLVVLFLLGIAHADEKDYAEIDAIRNERECIHQGGICVIEKDCPQGLHTAVKGLCPKQRDNGVECCYGISVKERRCSGRGGSCVPAKQCQNGPKAPEAIDCLPSEVCCVFVN